MKAIVTGMIGTYPLGGVAWDYGQYVLGMQRMGFEVTYLEDTGFAPYDPRTRDIASDASYGAAYLAGMLELLAPDTTPRWHFRAPGLDPLGISNEELADTIADADVLLNVSNSGLLRSEYLDIPCKVMIDTDPGWNQFVALPKWDRGHGWEGVPGYRRHDVFFSYAQAIGRASCRLPTLGIDWLPTLPPVVLDLWSQDGDGQDWTTVMNWEAYPQPIEHDGHRYGGKDIEFLDIISLPRSVLAHLQVAIDGKAPMHRLAENGWHVVDAAEVSATPNAYRDYVQRSRGEFSVAKNVYVATGSGWFSCRSVCYLAAGRPAVLQDTGFSSFIPTGDGLLAWRDIAGARVALERVEGDYEAHARAARDLATGTFAAEIVLGELLDRAGIG